MHQSRNEQSLARTRLLHPDRQEASIMARLDEDMEASEEWGGIPKHLRQQLPGQPKL